MWAASPPERGTGSDRHQLPKLGERALAIGEKLGIYRNYPCSKEYTSPFAPIWINEMVKRQR